MEAVPLPPLVAALLPVPADPFPQAATITASMARAARDHGVLLTSSLPCADWIDADKPVVPRQCVGVVHGAGDTDPPSPDPTGRGSCWFAASHASSLGTPVLRART